MGLIVDNFAGGGGASTGIERALGRSVDYAINHSAQAIAKSDGLLKQLLSLVEESKLLFEIIDCSITGPITGELPPPSTPSTPEEIVARSKWLHVVLTQIPGEPWQIACESDEKQDAIAAFNAQRKLLAKQKGRVMRFEHKTLKREFPQAKDEGTTAEAAAN